MMLRAVHVFTPNDFPKYTYVQRADQKLEQDLRDGLETLKQPISISGPSKSGKTVLVQKVVGSENLIPLSGAAINSPDELWRHVLDWMGAPSSVSKTSTTTESETWSAGASGGVGFPGVAKAGANSTIGTSESASNAMQAVYQHGGLERVRKEIADSEFVVFVDDFHYMNRETQVLVARHIKAASERGIRVCVASVPHRADDVVRGNPELRGRTTNIDIEPWAAAELRDIANSGFKALNASIPEDKIRMFAEEAAGSPQLMQSICLQTCFVLGHRESTSDLTEYALGETELSSILEQTSTKTDFGSLISNMHEGPKVRGIERKEFELVDGSFGDVYRAVLMALTRNPPQLTFRYSDLMKRVQSVCVGNVPTSQSVQQACYQMSKFALDFSPSERIFEWDDTSEPETLELVDPFFLFYMRASRKLDELAKKWKNGAATL